MPDDAEKKTPIQAHRGNDTSAKLVEAARYALLRRLAPAIRHDMVGTLHPIGLIAEITDRRLQEPQIDLASVQENIGKIRRLSRSALASCSNLVTWLAPEAGAVSTLGEGIDECVDLLHTEFGMRGFTLENEAREIDTAVSRAALRNALTAALIAAADSGPAPADLLLAAEVSETHALVSVVMRPADRDAPVAGDIAYRLLEWRDVEALAGAESVELSRSSDRVTLRYVIATAPAESVTR